MSPSGAAFPVTIPRRKQCAVIVATASVEPDANIHHSRYTIVRPKTFTFAILFPMIMVLCGCEDLVPRDTASLLAPHLQRSEIVGFIAGLGTTFAAVPDLLAMIKRRSSAGFNPRMAAIMGVFQILWVYYGLLIASRPVIAWNVIAVCINMTTLVVSRRFARREKALGQPA
jgi:uncharacterized protein with PQ loop repeat